MTGDALTFAGELGPPDESSPPGIFPWSDDWFHGVAELAQSAPSWVRAFAEIGTEFGILIFPVLFLAAWWRARGGDARGMTLALLAPVVTVGAYLVSESIKSVVLVARPCQDFPNVTVIAHCPPMGDWSFPSNHATIAAAAAMGAVLAWRMLAAIALPVAALEAFSRVFVGVHYPHDVAAGFLLGVTVATLLSLLLARLLTPLVRRLREHPLLRPLLVASHAGQPRTGDSLGAAR